MSFLIITLFLAGLAGLLGATFLPGLLAATVARLRPAAAGPALSESGGPPSMQFLVTAHNEEATIASTLVSLVQAGRAADVTAPAIVVGLDHCTDRTEAVVRKFAQTCPLPVTCQVKRGRPGKWRMLVELARSAQADWIAFADCGSIWDPTLVVRALPFLQAPGVQAIAPSYLPQRAGRLEQLNWRLEQTIKGLETWSGGPISVHGATVFYRRTTLLAVLDRLEGCDWLNDDLVIPTMIRLMDPAHRVVYLRFADSARAYVLDQGVKPDVAVEYRRRRRIMHGSVEWLQLMLTHGGFRQPVVGLLAVRRLCRMLWSYWVSSLLAAAVLLGAIQPGITGWHAVLSALVIGAVLVASNFTRRLAIAYLTALRTPFQIARHFAAGSAIAVDWQ